MKIMIKKIFFLVKKCFVFSVLCCIVSAFAAEKSVIKSEKIDADFAYNGNDLGLSVLDGNIAKLKCWAPLADEVKVLLYKDSSSLNKVRKSIKMERDADNSAIWKTEFNYSGYTYYQYQIKNNNKKNKVCDIWALSASPDSVASEIIDINKNNAAIPEGLINDKEWGTAEGYFNPFGNSGKELKNYSDAVIYEMHIRDWSHVEVKDSKGKFKEIADGTTVINHLKDLGVTHVQILPCFEYAQSVNDYSYNWGYNPYNYNVPEGRYVTEGYKNGSDAVKEMRYMIGKLHDNGIAVIMDVVYNHTNGTGKDSIYDMTVPYYFYRMKDESTYSNGSGCGNEIASNHKMVEKFIVDSVKHWVLDYHVNGFRFDLMGLHERTLMARIYNELYQIDPDIMVYGEPWTGGKSLVKFAVSKSTADLVTDENVNGIGVFNDTYRDSLKGNVFSPSDEGFIQGNYAGYYDVLAGLCGSIKAKGGFTVKEGRSINYVECHDNHTLFDKLACTELGKNVSGTITDYLNNEQMEIIKKQDKMAAAFIILAQGTPFINGGQEFLRSKKGDHNSYISGDDVNGIDLNLKENNLDVYNTYKALIKLRKNYPECFGSNYNCSAEMKEKGFIIYETGDFTVYLNCSSNFVKENINGTLVFINQQSGDFELKEGFSCDGIESESFMIIKK